MKHLLVLICLALLCAVASADDSSVTGVGGTVELMHPEHSSIRMLRETVNVSILDEYTAKVRCTFVFKNEGKATTVKMGFPEGSGGEGAPDPKSKKSALIGFKSWVDDKPVKTVFVPSKSNKEYSFHAWHVKSVPFAAGQTRTVIDTYQGGMGGDTLGWVNFNYTLISGASWKGKIGEAVIAVDASRILNRFRVNGVSPLKWTMTGGVYTWKLRNFEPREDIRINFRPKVDIWINGIPAPILYDRIDNVSTALTEDLDNQLPDVTRTLKGNDCTFKSKEHVLLLTVGSKTALLDGTKKITLPRAPFFAKPKYGNRDMVVPIAAVVRALGGKAQLVGDKNGQTLKITM